MVLGTRMLASGEQAWEPMALSWVSSVENAHRAFVMPTAFQSPTLCSQSLGLRGPAASIAGRGEINTHKGLLVSAKKDCTSGKNIFNVESRFYERFLELVLLQASTTSFGTRVESS